MTATQDTLFAALDKLGIVHRTIAHRPLFTVEDGRDLHDKIPGTYCNRLF